MPSSATFAKLIAISPKVTGALSWPFSGLLIHHIFNTPGQLSKVTNRLLLGVTITDCLYTFVTPFLSTWMVPASVVNAYGEEVDIYGNIGTELTCTIQGFCDQMFSKSSWMYNAELAVAYLIMVRYREGNKWLTKYEPILHILPLMLALYCAILPLVYQAYNPTGGWLCWIAESPLKCSENPDVECARGANWDFLRKATGHGPLFATQIIVAVAMLCVFCSVYSTEKRTDRYAVRGSTVSRKHSRQTALRCVLYVLAFEITWFFGIWSVIAGDYIKKQDHEQLGAESGDPIFYLNLLLLPTYGIWSHFAYFALPFCATRRAHPEWGFWRQYKHTVIPTNSYLCGRRPRTNSAWARWTTTTKASHVGSHNNDNNNNNSSHVESSQGGGGDGISVDTGNGEKEGAPVKVSAKDLEQQRMEDLKLMEPEDASFAEGDYSSRLSGLSGERRDTGKTTELDVVEEHQEDGPSSNKPPQGAEDDSQNGHDEDDVTEQEMTGRDDSTRSITPPVAEDVEIDVDGLTGHEWKEPDDNTNVGTPPAAAEKKENAESPQESRDGNDWSCFPGRYPKFSGDPDFFFI